jgi:hypothetical protein
MKHSRAEEYRRLAQECRDIARILPQGKRISLLQIAQTWRRLADEEDAMTDGSHWDDPAYWRKRAIEVRALADHVTVTAKADILRIAEDYDRLAERASERARPKKNPTERGG